MSPLRLGVRGYVRCFPRVSGDEPITFRKMGADYGFSPRERG